MLKQEGLTIKYEFNFRYTYFEKQNKKSSGFTLLKSLWFYAT